MRVILLCLLVAMSFVTKAQSSNEVVIVKTGTMSFNEQTKITSLTGNVALKDARLTVSNAEQVFIDAGTNKITILGPATFEFNGILVVEKQVAGKRAQMEYLPGENKLYIKQ